TRRSSDLRGAASSDGRNPRLESLHAARTVEDQRHRHALSKLAPVDMSGHDQLLADILKCVGGDVDGRTDSELSARAESSAAALQNRVQSGIDAKSDRAA